MKMLKVRRARYKMCSGNTDYLLLLEYPKHRFPQGLLWLSLPVREALPHGQVIVFHTFSSLEKHHSLIHRGKFLH